MTIDTGHIWEKAARSDNPYPTLLLGRSRDEYFADVGEVERWLQPLIEKARPRGEYFGEGLTIVEIGPGLHRFPRALHEKEIITPKDDLIGIDIIDKLLEQAPQWMECERSIANIRKQFVDIAYSFCVFQHLTGNQRKFYAKHLQRIVRPGGHVFIQLPNKECTYYIEKDTLKKFNPIAIDKLFPDTSWWKDIVPGNLSHYFWLEHSSDLGNENRELFLVAQRK